MLCSPNILEKISQPFKGLFHFFKVVCVGCQVVYTVRDILWLFVRTANNTDRQSVVNMFTTTLCTTDSLVCDLSRRVYYPSRRVRDFFFLIFTQRK